MAVRLKELVGTYGIARLEAGAAIPVWADGEGFVSIGRTEDELSVVCRAERIPDDVKRELEWTAFKFIGPFAFNETGILLSVIQPLSANGIGIFAVSTFDTDYLLVKSAQAAVVREHLLAAGHQFVS